MRELNPALSSKGPAITDFGKQVINFDKLTVNLRHIAPLAKLIDSLPILASGPNMDQVRLLYLGALFI